MTSITATDAKNSFGRVLDMAQAGPVHIQKNGRDVAVVISAAEFERLKRVPEQPKVRPAVEELLQRSIVRHGKVYEALAK